MHKKLKKQKRKQKDLEKIRQERARQNAHIIAGEICDTCIYHYTCMSYKKKTIGRCDAWLRKEFE